MATNSRPQPEGQPRVAAVRRRKPTTAPAPRTPTVGTVRPITPPRAPVKPPTTTEPWRQAGTPEPLTPGDLSARSIIMSFLGQYGLTSLADFAWDAYLKGVPISQIMLDIRARPEYKTRFPAMGDLAAKGRAISEQQYVNLEQSYSQVLHSYGLPAGFYDTPDDFAKFMTGDVSPSELNDRVKQYTTAVMGDRETLAQMAALYQSVGHSGDPAADLLAHYLDPSMALPLLTERLSASQFAAAGKISGYGQLSRAQAEQYSARLDTSAEQARQGFGTLVHARELFQGLPGEGQDDLGQDVQLGAIFGGDARAQEKISQRARLRVAQGSGGGGFTTTREGAVGLTSQQT